MGQVGISKKHELKIFDLPKSSLLVYTVEPHYFELGSFEVPAISKEDRMPLDLPFPFMLPRYFELVFIFLGLRNSGVRL